MTRDLSAPFVPFTFSTVTFCGYAVDLGLMAGRWPYIGLWSWADEGWKIYSAARRTGALPDSQAGDTAAARRVLVAGGMQGIDADAWLKTAEAMSYGVNGFLLSDFTGGGGPIRDIIDLPGQIVTGVGEAAGRGIGGVAAGLVSGRGLVLVAAGVLAFGLWKKGSKALTGR